MKKYKKQGKRNRAAGARFELRVRKDLEDKGWIVSKWMNNVQLASYDVVENGKKIDVLDDSFLIPAKHKFRGPGIPMAIGTGFPDFIVYTFKQVNIDVTNPFEENIVEGNICTLIGVEVKSNGYLTKEEKEKCKWLLDNHIFSKILIASKGKKRGEILYKEFS